MSTTNLDTTDNIQIDGTEIEKMTIYKYLGRTTAMKNRKVSTGICLFVGCSTSQQHATCVSQGRICADNFTCCHTEKEVADQTFYLTQSQCTDTGPTTPSGDPIMPGAWQGSHSSAIFLSHWYDSTRKNPVASGIQTPDLPLPRRTP